MASTLFALIVSAPAATAMTAGPQAPQHVSVEDYLTDEQRADIKHEYLDGLVVAMGGASRRHGLLTLSLSALLLPHARSQGCQLFAGDMKVRINHDQGSWFYYPDLVLACEPSDNEPLFVQRPCLLVEVLSPSTEQTDTREKLLAYRLLPAAQPARIPAAAAGRAAGRPVPARRGRPLAAPPLQCPRRPRAAGLPARGPRRAVRCVCRPA